MISKYSSSGGELYHDNCFYVTMPITKVDDEGREYQADDEVHVDLTWVESLQEHIIEMN